MADLGRPYRLSAGIGVIGMASPMLQEIFGDSLIAHPELNFSRSSTHRKPWPPPLRRASPVVTVQHRRPILLGLALRLYRAQEHNYTFFLLGILLYAAAPWAAHIGNKVLFVAFLCVILSMYGGGFATVLAYLADVFRTQFVGAIHGRLLTAWSTAGIVLSPGSFFGRKFGSMPTSSSRRKRRPAVTRLKYLCA